MNEEKLYQILYVQEGKERFSYAEPYDVAKKHADQLQNAGREVLSIMTRTAAQDYLRQATRYRDVDHELSDSVVTPEAPETAPDHNRARVQLRHIAVELALEMRGGTADDRTAGELVADSETILKFLEG
jgi:hypothetical protein